ncbi:MAG TPA: type II toxin-antitoxin system RelE/ParE family toxin [Candidatus Acidoferrales bacterium]
MPEGYQLRMKHSAERELRALPKTDLKRIVERIQQLASKPRPFGSEKLSGQHAYRIRQEDYRVVYAVDDKRRVVEIVKIGHRREVYRRRG